MHIQTNHSDKTIKVTAGSSSYDEAVDMHIAITERFAITSSYHHIGDVTIMIYYPRHIDINVVEAAIKSFNKNGSKPLTI
jgi:hypothetical protein